jgi:integrase
VATQGHIRRRGKGWCVVVDIGKDEEGRRRQRWHSGYRTSREAKAALVEILGRVQRGEYVEASKETLAEFMRDWMGSLRATLRPSTIAGYEALTQGHIIPVLGNVPLQRLTAAQLTSFYGDLLATGRRSGKGGLSARTVHYVHATMHKALGEAVRWGLVLRNVAEQATPPRPQAKEMRTWSASELRDFLEAVQGDRLCAAYLLAATTGLRRGEVLGLRWRDLDFEARRLAVTQTLVCVRYAVVVSTPKTARGKRSVALDTGTVAALRAHRKRLLEERLYLGLGAPSPDDLVFTSQDGSPLHPGQFADRFERLVKAAGVPRIRFHDLRHTHATLALQAGVHPKVVSERLGHASVSITLDTYSHAIPALQEEAADKVARVVFGA